MNKTPSDEKDLLIHESDNVPSKKNFYIRSECASDIYGVVHGKSLYCGPTAKSLEEIADIINRIPRITADSYEGLYSIADILVETKGYKYPGSDRYDTVANYFDLRLDTNCTHHCSAPKKYMWCSEIREQNLCVNKHLLAIVDQVCNCK
ncbi:MAG: hypothetical protein LBI17_01485 [Rickettsiales bacterium]|nr:hypothetical protein [Rickettsiales bacterium]